MMNTIIIFGSAASRGNTWDAVCAIDPDKNIPFIDLKTLNITDFDYDHANESDDFIPLIETIINYENIIIATPIYWYTCSGLVKRFIDRLGDLVTIRTDLGRQLRNKNLWVIASYGTHPEGMAGFEMIFENIATYLGIFFQQTYFHYSGDIIEVAKQNPVRATAFIDSLISLINKNS